MVTFAGVGACSIPSLRKTCRWHKIVRESLLIRNQYHEMMKTIEVCQGGDVASCIKLR
jgi:hypothetical protein